MQFKGNYEVTRELKANTINVTTAAELHGTLDVTGTSKLGAVTIAPNKNVDAGNNRIFKLGTPVNPTDAVTKQYVDSATVEMFTGEGIPPDSLGVDKDIYMQGFTGGPLKLTAITDSTGSNDIGSDGSTIIVSTNSTTGKFYKSIDHGRAWTVHSAIADATNRFKATAAVSSSNFVMLRDRIGGAGTNPPIYSTDSGLSWQPATINETMLNAKPTRSLHVSTVGAVANNVVILTDTEHPLISNDKGKTYHFPTSGTSASTTYVACGMQNENILLLTSTNTVIRSLNGGNDFTTVGSLPGISATWVSIVAMGDERFMALPAGAGSTSVAYSDDDGSTWRLINLGQGDIDAADGVYNAQTKMISIVSKTKKVFYARGDNVEAWGTGVFDGPIEIADIAPHGSGFVGVTVAASPHIAYTFDGMNWSTNKPKVFDYMYMKHAGHWIYMSNFTALDASGLFISKNGGNFGGDINMDGYDLAGLPDPKYPTSPVTKSYLEAKLQSENGEYISKTVGTGFDTIDTVDKLVETIRYMVSAKVGTKRYYSQVDVIANGTNDPASTEYSVLSIGGLDIELEVSKDGTGNTVLKAKSSDNSTVIRVKREVLDI